MGDLVVKDDKGQSYVIDNTRVFTPANMVLGALCALVIGYFIGHSKGDCCSATSDHTNKVIHDYNSEEVAQ